MRLLLKAFLLSIVVLVIVVLTERYWMSLLGLDGIGIDVPFQVGKFGTTLFGLGFLVPIWLFVFVVVLLMVILADQVHKLKDERKAAAKSGPGRN